MMPSTLYPTKAASRPERIHARRAADWLSLAAAPSFALMALVTTLGDGPDMLCAAAHTMSPLNGMVPMYLLMSVFHLTPWLRLISGRG